MSQRLGSVLVIALIVAIETRNVRFKTLRFRVGSVSQTKRRIRRPVELLRCVLEQRRVVLQSQGRLPQAAGSDLEEIAKRARQAAEIRVVRELVPRVPLDREHVRQRRQVMDRPHHGVDNVDGARRVLADDRVEQHDVGEQMHQLLRLRGVDEQIRQNREGADEADGEVADGVVVDDGEGGAARVELHRGGHAGRRESVRRR